MTDISQHNGILIRIFDEELALYKKDIPNLIAMWSLTDDDVLKVMAAERMRQSFRSAPAKWHVQPRELCDEAVLGYRLGILTEDQLPLPEAKR